MISNCLFEAVKAKIKDPRNVKIFKMPKELNKDVTHFMWCDEDFYYHGYNYKHTKNPFLFDCKIKKIPRYIFESFILGNIKFCDKNYKIKIVKKCFMRIGDYQTNWDWSFYEFQHDELPSQDYINFFEKVMKCHAKFKICINGELKTTSLKSLKSQTCDFEWKMVDLYDPDFDRVYRNHKTSSYEELED